MIPKAFRKSATRSVRTLAASPLSRRILRSGHQDGESPQMQGEQLQSIQSTLGSHASYANAASTRPDGLAHKVKLPGKLISPGRISVHHRTCSKHENTKTSPYGAYPTKRNTMSKKNSVHSNRYLRPVFLKSNKAPSIFTHRYEPDGNEKILTRKKRISYRGDYVMHCLQYHPD